jgi:3-dehydroquinate synthetase
VVSATRLEVRAGALRSGPARPEAPGGLLLLADENTQALIPHSWSDVPRHVIPAGEASKSWEVLGGLLGALDAEGLDRDGHLLAVGGGVVTDLGGLAASLHRRGIPWTAVPTSLIGQADAAVGGKTAVNLGGGKNTVGSFHPPAHALVDPEALATLPAPHLRSGMAELLKTALIAGAGPTQATRRLTPETLASAGERAEAVVESCLATKLELVTEDLHDQGVRRKLNLGHTFGHAFESLRLGELLHGEAVGLGLLCSARLAAGLPGTPLEEELREVLASWGLPVRAELEPEAVLGAMLRDKKRRDGGHTAVLLHAPGRVVVREGVPEAALAAALGAVLGST